MKIEKLPSGNYRVRKMINGKSHTFTFDHKPTQKEIQNELNKKLDFHNGKMTFYEAATNYIEARTNTISPSTIKEYEGTLNRLPDKLTNKLIDDIKQNDIQYIVNELSVKLKPKTVKNYHSFIASVLSEFRPEFIIKTKLPMQVKEEPYIPTKDEIKALLEVAKDTPYEVPILLGCCSMRRGEICALTMNDIDFENRIIHVNKDMVLDRNKEWVIKPPKTLVSIRDIQVPEQVIDAIKRNGLYEGHPNNISDWMDRKQKETGLPHFSLHKTRHYFVTTAHDKGISDANIMAAGGWATPNVMIKHYRHATNESGKVTNSVMNDLF